VRACPNLSVSRKKSSPVTRNSDRAILKAKCVLTERDLASVSRIRGELRRLVDRFDAELWQIVHRGCRR
jgi:hypothetical protein